MINYDCLNIKKTKKNVTTCHITSYTESICYGNEVPHDLFDLNPVAYCGHVAGYPRYTSTITTVNLMSILVWISLPDSVFFPHNISQEVKIKKR